jgi:hypothetical protein
MLLATTTQPFFIVPHRVHPQGPTPRARAALANNRIAPSPQAFLIVLHNVHPQGRVSRLLWRTAATSPTQLFFIVPHSVHPQGGTPQARAALANNPHIAAIIAYPAVHNCSLSCRTVCTHRV